MVAKEIIRGIKISQDPKLAKENLKFLLNISKNKLTPETISQVLAITEKINSGSRHVSHHYKSHYGFKGGKLTKESLNNILKAKYKDDMLAIMMIAMHID